LRRADLKIRSSTGPAPDKGRIYFYPTMLLDIAVQPEAKVNGEVVGRAVPNGFFYVDRKRLIRNLDDHRS